MIRGQRFFHENENRGISCIGGSRLEDTWIWSRFAWPKEFVCGMLDKDGKAFGCKTTTLEAIGLLIPFLAFPEKVVGKHLIFKIDNIGVFYGWHNGRVKNDSTATEIVQCAHYLAAYLGSTIHVDHMPRNSDDMSELADELSRKNSSESKRKQKALEKAEFRITRGYLLKWLNNPKCGNLMNELLRELKMKIP